MDAFSQIAGVIEDANEVWRLHPGYFLYEPWDVAPRSPEIMRQAIDDGVDLDAPDLMRCVGPAPHFFQSGFLLSTKFFRGAMAAGQCGKTVGVAVEVLCSATGEIPFALRYPAGHDTGIPRLLTKENIIRWGRRSKDTGEIIDHNWRCKQDDSWDCGNVTGVGVFPSEKIVPEGSLIRIASRQKLILQNWWPAFTGARKDGLGAFVPPFFIDKTRGSYQMRGSNKQDYQVFLKRGVVLQMLTYESGKEVFEGIKVPTYLDEEPLNEEIIGAVVTHASRWALIETPYEGITFSRELIFPKVRTPDMETFHATAYDCPYLTPSEIQKQRAIIGERTWEIGARLWGIPTEQSGKPYYDRKKINFWMQRFSPSLKPKKLVRFEPVGVWANIKSDERISKVPGLLDTEVRMADAEEEDQQSVWRLYEDRQAGTGYASASDQAEGAEVPDMAGDLSVAMIGRSHLECPTRPVLCASLRSTLPTPQFAREVLYAARYFNNALLAPETGPGAANESFRMVANDWPWWFKDTTIRQSTRKPRERQGFQPTSDRRDAVFDKLIRDWLDEYDQDSFPELPDEWVLRELAGAITGTTRGGKARCDHPRDGTLDSAMAFGILLFVFQPEFYRQVKCNASDDRIRRRSWLEESLYEHERSDTSEPPVVYLGEKMCVRR